MKMSSLVAAFGFTFVAVGPSLAADGPSGNWVVEDHSAVVRLSKCGGGYCGFVAKGGAGKDYRNPDPSKRSRSLTGIEVMFSMKPAGANAWTGQTYNADDGQMYTGTITLTSPNSLKVQGCTAGGICGSQNWTRQ